MLHHVACKNKELAEVKISLVVAKTDLERFKQAVLKVTKGDVQFETSESDLEALQKTYLVGRPELLIIDLDLPAVIGRETVASMRKQQLAEIPVLLASVQPAIQIEGDPKTLVIEKGCPDDDLKNAVKKLLYPATAHMERITPSGVQPSAVHFEGPESRKAHRKPMQASCIVLLATNKTQGRLRDISLTGARIKVNMEIPISSFITLMAGVPGSVPLKVIQFKARVVRKCAEDEYGLAFREMDAESHNFLKYYTEKEPPPPK